jgi:ankyrin repeat protein
MHSSRFRWVYCQLERLRHCLVSSVRLILDELPETLDETYARILGEISKENRDHAHRLLQCLTVAARPLRVEELAEVFAIDFTAEGTPKLNVDLRWEDQEEAILLACSSLVAVIDDPWHGSRIVQFSHFSVKEFLTSDRLAALQDVSYYHVLPERASRVMVQACLAVLLRLDYDSDRECMKSLPLANYAATHFGNHAESENVISPIRDGIDTLLDEEKPHFAAWVWARDLADYGWSGTTYPVPLNELPLYHVVRLGFIGLVQHLMSKRPQDVTANSRYSYRLLQRALVNGHEKVSQLLIPYCVDVNTRVDHRTLLHWASIPGWVDFGQQLIDRGADINARGANIIVRGADIVVRGAGFIIRGVGFEPRRIRINARWREDGTPLHVAAEHGHVNFARMLIELNADVCTVDSLNQTPLHVASSRGHWDVMQLLLDKRVDVDCRCKDRMTPLHYALRSWNPEAVRLLLESGANVCIRDKEGKTALHIASEWGNPDIMRLLLDQGAEVDAQDKSHSTPLHYASRSGEPEAVRLLLESGANVRTQNKEGKTTLHFASEWGNPDMIQLLLDQGLEVDPQDKSHSTPLHYALRSGEREAVRLLLESGANVHRRDKEGKTTLHFASEWGNLDIMRLLLDQGLEVDPQDRSHSTSLHYALRSGEREAVRLLLESGANVHTQDKQGKTTLHFASQWGSLDIIRLSLERGLEVDAQDKSHSTPLHYALWNRKPEAVRLLLESGANIRTRDKWGRTTLHFASQWGSLDIMRLSLERGLEVDVQDKSHLTPFHYALYGQPQAAQLLLESGANICAQDREGRTALHIASQGGNLEIMRSLLDQGLEADEQVSHTQFHCVMCHGAGNARLPNCRSNLAQVSTHGTRRTRQHYTLRHSGQVSTLCGYPWSQV